MRGIKTFLFLVLAIGPINGQHNDGQAAVYNMATSAVIGGIGAMINKKQGQKTHKVLFKGMAQGALGGYLVFESKRLLRNLSLKKDYTYVWPSRILNSAGNSMVMNAASNRDFWERWYLNIGFGHFEYDLKRERRLSCRIMPITLFGNIYGFTQGKLDVSKSIQTGVFIFKSDQLFFKNVQKEYVLADGITILNTIWYDPKANIDTSTFETITHELVHVFQYEDLMATNSYFDRLTYKSRNWERLPKWYDKIFYTDFHSLSKTGINGVIRLLGVPHENRFYEKEAFYFDGSKNR